MFIQSSLDSQMHIQSPLDGHMHIQLPLDDHTTTHLVFYNQLMKQLLFLILSTIITTSSC
jgi:hypothetical protein